MTIDPQAQAMLDAAAAAGAPPMEELTPEQVRAAAEEGADAQFGPKEDVHSVEDIVVAGIPVRVYAPSPDEHLPLAVFLHGGGWVVGSVHTHDGISRALANASGCRVATAGYRLAPEHPFPAAVEDAWAVTRWAFEQAPRVAVAGDSAGGNLAAVMALMARDEGLPLAFQLLAYPVLDHSYDTPSYVANATGRGLTRSAMQWFWEHYLGGADGAHPHASPLRAPSVAGVAPALVMVCELDPLRDEGVAYADRLRAAGVPTEVIEYEGMIHGFLRMAALIDRSRQAIDAAGAALRKALTVD